MWQELADRRHRVKLTRSQLATEAIAAGAIYALRGSISEAAFRDTAASRCDRKSRNDERGLHRGRKRRNGCGGRIAGSANLAASEFGDRFGPEGANQRK
jgi:hypothetical protein